MVISSPKSTKWTTTSHISFS